MENSTITAYTIAIDSIRTCASCLNPYSSTVTRQTIHQAVRHLNDYADLLKKEIAAGAANTRDESKENISTNPSIAANPEPVKFGEQERLRALRSLVVSMGMSPELCAGDIVRAVTVYLEEVLKP